jgi:hypothetical protein
MIELIKDKNKCESTCYFEFLPGIYQDNCWNDNSVFIDYQQIYYIEPILEKYINNYDHYSFMSGSKYDWQEIIKELNQMKEVLRKAENLNDFTSTFDFTFWDSEENFAKDFDKSKAELLKMIDDFVLWVQETLKNYDKIAILGM